MICWQTTKNGKSGLGLEMGGHYHMLEKLNDRKLEDNRRQAAQKRSIEYPDQLKQEKNNKKWKEFTNLNQELK
jgi:hypothetical protein